MTTAEQRALPLFSSGARVEDRNRKIGESMWAYLEVSAFAGDDRVRDQLEQMAAAVPHEHHHDIVSRLRGNDDRRVKDAVSELVVFQGLLEAGRTDIEVAPATPDGETDYRLSALGVHFEVTRVGESALAHGDRQRRYQVLDKLNELDCGRFSLRATLHSGKQVPSVKEVRSQIETWLAGLNATAERAALEAAASATARYDAPSERFQFGDWTVQVEAWPLATDAPSERIIGTILEPFNLGPVTVESIRKSLKKKRRQHANLDEPLVVVLDVSSGHVSDNLLADAFFGKRPLVGWGRPLDTGALWPTPARLGCSTVPTTRKPEIVGVLVLDHLHINGLEAVDATFWLPQTAAGPVLPGPWRMARWLPGMAHGADIGFDDTPQKYFLNFSRPTRPARPAVGNCNVPVRNRLPAVSVTLPERQSDQRCGLEGPCGVGDTAL